MKSNVELASSFGVDATTMGPEFRVLGVENSERYRVLDRRASYYNCTHHDFKTYDFDGRPIPTGNPMLGQPLLASQPSDVYVPLKMRRPSAPYRLARVIVDSFTNLIFGHQRWPTIRAPGDPATEEFVRALVDAMNLRTLMVRVRALGGSAGTVGISWRISNGTPRARVHHAKNLIVHAWADRELLQPSHITEIYRYPRDEWDPEKRTMARNWYWFRHDWTPTADVAFFEVKYESNANPEWVIDEANSFEHCDGFAHFVWCQNLPSEIESIDGVPDYEGLYENFDALDLLNSVLVRGTTLNLDPTLVLRMDPEIVSRTNSLRKGTDNSIVVGTSGDARYMELQGSSVQVGTTLFAKMREAALEVAQCVVPDPNQVSAAGTSSVALKVTYAPMLAKADVLREHYEESIRALLVQMLRSCRRQLASRVEYDVEGRSLTVEPYLALPPKVVEVPVLDDEGEPTGRTEERLDDLHPGRSDLVAFDWGDYFTPTAADQMQVAQTLVQMTVGKLISQESGADLASRVLRIDPRSDWERIANERDAAKAQADGMFSDIGGQVSAVDELPPGAEPRSDAPPETAPSTVGGASVELTASDMASIVTVNEGRASSGLGPLMRPDGTMDPDGHLTITEFRAAREARGATEGEVEGAATASHIDVTPDDAALLP